MANELRSLGLFDAVEIVPLATADWYPTLAGGDFREILDKIESAAQCLLSSSSSSSSSSKKLLVVGHSAGGWLARCWMGSQPYSGGVVYSGASRVDTLLTLVRKKSPRSLSLCVAK
jgi:triacylglycerol esterase/lipase EstA (alpha/beta hydrolase family)